MLVAAVSLAAAAGGEAVAAAPPSDAPDRQPKTWEHRGGGQWHAVPPPPASRSATDQTPLIENPTLDRAERLLVRRQHGAARPIIVGWLRRNRDAPDRDRGLFLLAQAYYQYGDRIRAFYHLDELMDNYPESPLFYPALEMQFRIADRYLRGYKDRLFGIPMIGQEDNAIEMLFRIQERSPGSPLAERALLRTADYYYDNADYDFASDVYRAYADRYPRSPEMPRVRLRQAYSSLAQFRGLDFDATPLVDARAQLEDILKSDPELAERENIAEVIEGIDARMASKLYRRANYYRRTNQPQAAAFTYRSIISQYPDAPEARRARRRLARLPAAPANRPAGADVPQPTEPDTGAGAIPGPDVR